MRKFEEAILDAAGAALPFCVLELSSFGLRSLRHPPSGIRLTLWCYPDDPDIYSECRWCSSRCIDNGRFEIADPDCFERLLEWTMAAFAAWNWTAEMVMSPGAAGG